MFYKILLVFVFFFLTNLFASYEDGKKIFNNKCSSCHGKYISIDNLKINFFEKKNKLYNLDTPTENMLAYAIMDSSKKIGDPEDPEMRKIEIEEYLKDFLSNPDLSNSICDPMIINYYKDKKAIKISDNEAANLADFFINYYSEYRKANPEKIKVLNKNYNEKSILQEAKENNKNILVYATSNTCYFCKRMEKDVINTVEIKELMYKDYVFIKIDVDKTMLPFGLSKKFEGMTPTFFFLNSRSVLKNIYPGAWKMDDFKILLKENKN